jgi:4-carboxymuconolactone decarboxylase
VGDYVRFASALTVRMRELAMLVVAREWSCDPMWTHHAVDGARAGISRAAIHAIAADGEVEGLREDESAAVRFARQLLRRNRVDAGTFATLRASLGDLALIDLIATLGYYTMIACAFNTVAMPVEQLGTPSLPRRAYRPPAPRPGRSRTGEAARLPLIRSKELIPVDAHAHFDAIAASRGGRVGGPFAVMMHSPEVASRVAHLGTYLRFECLLSPRTIELVSIVGARELDCEFEWGIHATAAAREGIPQPAIDAIATGATHVDLPDDDAVVMEFTRELLRGHRVDDRTFLAARASLGDAGVVELTAMIGYFATVCYALNVAEVPGADGAPALPPFER